MKVLEGSNPTQALRRLTIAITLAIALSFLLHAAPASAITRSQVMKRANHWVAKKVPYSQRGYYQGYRRDCSGFVSMSWKLKRSYTTRTIGQVSKRINRKRLRPGDAILSPGHVVIFGGWKNKAKTRYVALEESRSGKPALKRVKTWRRGSKAIRYRWIKNDPKKVVKVIKVVKPPVAPPVTSTPIAPPETTSTPVPAL